MRKATSSNTIATQPSAETEKQLLKLASFYIDTTQYSKAGKMLNFLAARYGNNSPLIEERLTLQIMVLFHLNDHKRCVNIAIKLYKNTKDEDLKLYLLLTLNKCFIALDDLKEAQKYQKAYLQRLRKYEQ